MYSVLIADDEEPVLDSYQFMLEQMPDFQLAGKARSGDEAFSLMYSLKPDIAIFDISMPGLDGIEVIEKTHEAFKNTVFILSTAYERFDLARRAIPLGVFAYIVKPVTKKVFMQTLLNAQESIEKREVTPEKRQEKKNEFLQKTIWQDMTAQKVDEFKTLFGFESRRYCVALVDIPQTFRSDYVKRLAYRHRFAHAPYMSYLELLFCLDSDDASVIIRDIEDFAEQVLPAGEPFATACGSSVTADRLSASAGEALSAITKPQEGDVLIIQKQAAEVRNAFRNGADAAALKQQVAKLWKLCLTTEGFDSARCRMAGLFALLVDDMCGGWSNRAGEPVPVDVALGLGGIKTDDQFLIWSAQAIDTLCKLAVTDAGKNIPLQLEKALSYIQEHFAEPIRLSSVSETIGVSDSYLSRLFTEYMRTGFSDYVTTVRINKAKNLLGGNLNIREVAYTCGFQDANYFIRQFRKQTGMTPGQYKHGEDK
ncbi:MAG: helix-turn-helix domain-containing protein [Treponema sp.]|nr:helix-turn-helix domain-containing protein [Candidatus Treponema caballi]